MYRKLFLIALIISTIGCQSALLSTVRENERSEQRINEKEQDLQYLENQNTKLTEEKQRLLSELDNKELTLNGLYSRLDDLEKENALIEADTSSQKKQRQNFKKQIKTYKYQINAVKNNNQLSVQEKQKKIEALKKEVKAYLMMGLR